MTTSASTRAPLPLWAAFVASALGGISLDASFPSFGVWPLAFVAVALALVSLIGRRSWAAFGVGAAFGAAFYFPHIDWAASFLGDHPLSWVPWAALAGIQTFFTALGAVVLTLAYRWSHSLIGRPGVRVAAKSGTWGPYRHEAAVVTHDMEQPVALCIMTESMEFNRRVPSIDDGIGEMASILVDAIRARSES